MSADGRRVKMDEIARKRKKTALRANIALLHKLHWSQREIAKKLKTSHWKVRTVVSKVRTGLPLDDLPRSGRPSISTKRQDRVLKRLITGSPQKRKRTRQQISQEWSEVAAVANPTTGSPPSRSTITRRLKKLGYKSRVAARKPLMTQKNLKARLQWCKDHRHWTIEQWEKVLWSDETGFKLVAGRSKRVWRLPGERYDPDCQTRTVKHGGGTLMLWGCACAAGTGSIKRIEGIMRSEDYREILENSMVPSMRELGTTIFQHDNDPKHTSRLCRTFLDACDEVEEVLEWPSQSPDLNIMEDVWNRMKRALDAMANEQGHPTSILQLQERVVAAWDAIPAEFLSALVRTIPDRIAAVIKNRGYPTRF